MRVHGAYLSTQMLTIYLDSKFLATFQEKIGAYRAIMGTKFVKDRWVYSVYFFFQTSPLLLGYKIYD
jgi:hypothetical protein